MTLPVECGGLGSSLRDTQPGGGETVAIIQRLEAATGPAIVFDAELFWLFDRQRATTAFWRGAMGLPKPLPDDFSRLPRGLGMASLEVSAPNYTASLDAALALAERVLPGWLWSVTTITTSVGGKRKPLAVVMHPDHPGGEEIHTLADAPTPALALCIAILRARASNSASPGLDGEEG